jgi:hypothetical protein
MQSIALSEKNRTFHEKREGCDTQQFTIKGCAICELTLWFKTNAAANVARTVGEV